MKLEVDKTYKAKDCAITRIGGFTKNHPNFVWGTNGHWYEASTGFWINVTRGTTGGPDFNYTPVDNYHALVAEVPSPGERPVDMRPAKNAWAPGPYLTKCLCCDWTFLGAKRAYVCAPCPYQDDKVS